MTWVSVRRRTVDDEVAARRDLRDQVARLERELQDTLVTAFPRTGLDVSLTARRTGGPRVLTLGELEDLRDRLSAKLVEARGELAQRVDAEHENRLLLERMLLEPGKYRHVRIRNADVGIGGCGIWQVRPRLGLIGMLCGWWQVKLSSGCPVSPWTRLHAHCGALGRSLAEQATLPASLRAPPIRRRET